MAEGRRGQRMEMAVIIPIVPSEPMKSCLMSKPMTEFNLIVPFGLLNKTYLCYLS